MSLTIEERQLVVLRIRNDAPSLVVAYVMWGFLGLISAHRFYLGRPRSAVLQILSLVTVVGWFVWWLYDAVMISAYIRDDKNALRVQLVSEMEGEHGRAAPAPRPRIVETPAAPAMASPPIAAAAAMPAAVDKAAPEADLVLVAKTSRPLVLGEPSTALDKAGSGESTPAAAAPAKPAAAKPTVLVHAPADASPKVADKLGDRAEAQAAATLAFSPLATNSDLALEREPTPDNVAKTVAVPHPEVIDDSPIEVFPPHKTDEGSPSETPLSEASDWVMAEPLRVDRAP